MENRQLPSEYYSLLNGPARKPLRARSNLVVSTARREIHSDDLHRTELSPTLQGFFYGNGDSLSLQLPELRGNSIGDGNSSPQLPCKNYGQFARLYGTSVSVDPSLSFLRKALPRNQHLFLLNSCNGLLLLGLMHSHYPYGWPEYVVCNPATQQWVVVPPCNGIYGDVRNPKTFSNQTRAYLLFDPAVSSHFHVLLFFRWHDMD